jgi:hypothetical protein
MKSKLIGQPSVASDDLVQSIDQKIYKWQFTISELLYEFPQISCNILHKIIAVIYYVSDLFIA